MSATSHHGSLGHGGRRRQRLDRSQIPLGLLVLAIMAVLIWISIIAINGIPFSNPMPLRAVLPPTGPIVKRGDDVLIAGQRVGEVRGVDPVAGGRLVRMKISRSDPVGRDASARIRLRGLAGATYVELDPGNPTRRAPDNFTIPLSRTRTNTQLTDVVAQFGAAARRDMSRTLSSYGAGLVGRGREINQAVADLPTVLSRGQPLLRSMVPQTGMLSGLVHELDRTMVGFQGVAPGDLGGLLGGFRLTFDALVSQRAELGRMIDELRPFSDQALATLPIADPVLEDASATVRALEPAMTGLRRALPSLTALLARSRDVGQLSRLGRALDPVLASADPVLSRLWPAAASLAPLAAAVGPFAQYLAPYGDDLFLGPYGFTSRGWGGFSYAMGQASGHKAVRFAPVFTCTPGRNPYPKPGQALKDRQRCPY